MSQNIANQIKAIFSRLWANAPQNTELVAPFNENQRQQAVVESGLNIPGSVEKYENIVQQAAFVCETPIALMSILDGDRQFFKAKLGLEVDETPRDWAFCNHAILNPYDVLEVEDATKDARFATNPLVTDDPNIRFYAGVPLVNPEGYPLGTLCVIDSSPRTLSSDQKLQLKLLAQELMVAIELQKLGLPQP